MRRVAGGVEFVDKQLSPEYLRVKQWREANPDRYREKQREVMKRRRARLKLANSTSVQPEGVPASVLEGDGLGEEKSGVSKPPEGGEG